MLTLALCSACMHMCVILTDDFAMVFRWTLGLRLHYDGQEGRRDVLGALGGLRGGRGGLPRA